MKKLVWEEGSYSDKTTCVAYVNPEQIVAIEPCPNRSFSKILLASGGSITVGLWPGNIIKTLGIEITNKQNE